MHYSLHVYVKFDYLYIFLLRWVLCPWQAWKMNIFGFPDRLGHLSAWKSDVIRSIWRLLLQAPETTFRLPWLRVQTTKAPLSLWSICWTPFSMPIISWHVLSLYTSTSKPNILNRSSRESKCIIINISYTVTSFCNFLIKKNSKKINNKN